MTMPQRIGIFGGTFNPIHLGHLVIAEAAWQEYDLDKVVFVPASHPPHKQQDSDVAPNELRYEMVRLAIADNPHFDISDVELRREGLSYTVDTLRYFHTQYPAGTEFYFIIGTDTLEQLPTWKYIDELIELCHFVSALRPHYQVNWEHLTERFGDLAQTRIHYLATPQLEISATDLRRRLCTGQSVRYLMPDPVRRRLTEKGIYDC